MKQYFFSRILGMVFLATVSISCSSNLDFDQVNNVTTQPIGVGNLASFDVPANEFVTNGVELTVSGALQNFSVFRDTYLKNRLIKTEFDFEINNTISRDFIIDLVLLDSSNLPLYNIKIDVPAYSGTEKLVTKREIFEDIKLDLLKRTSKIGFRLTLLPGTVLTETSAGSLKLRSSATVYLDIR